MNRAIRVSSTTVGSNRGIEKISQMLERNDYPTDAIERSKKRAIQRNRSQHQRKEKTCRDGVLCLPYISDEVTRRVRKIVKKSGLNIHIARRSGPTLRSILTRLTVQQTEQMKVNSQKFINDPLHEVNSSHMCTKFTLVIIRLQEMNSHKIDYSV